MRCSANLLCCSFTLGVLLGGVAPLTADEPVERITQTAEIPVRHRGPPLVQVAFSNDLRHAISGGIDGVLKLYDLQSGKTVKSLAGFNSVEHIAFAPDNKRAVFMTGVATLTFFGGNVTVASKLDPPALLWELETGKSIAAVDGKNTFEVAAFSRWPPSTLRPVKSWPK